MRTLLKTFVLVFMAINLSFAQNPTATIKTTKLSENLYKFFIYFDINNSVNTFAFIGSDGILLIDAGFYSTTNLLRDELTKISDKKITYLINTHYDGDHTGGNAIIGFDASILAHQECRNMLIKISRFPSNGLPNITFQDSAKIFFNDEEIVLKYFPGHTNTDIIVQFKKANIVFIGDLIFSDS